MTKYLYSHSFLHDIERLKNYPLFNIGKSSVNSQASLNQVNRIVGFRIIKL